jgi:hypothetical protein
MTMRKYYEGLPAAATVEQSISQAKQDHSAFTPRQQGIIAAVYGVVMLVFYTLMGVL